MPCPDSSSLSTESDATRATTYWSLLVNTMARLPPSGAYRQPRSTKNVDTANSITVCNPPLSPPDGVAV